MYKHSNNKAMTTGAIAAMLSTILYSRRFFPYYVYNIIGGLDEEGKVFLVEKEGRLVLDVGVSSRLEKNHKGHLAQQFHFLIEQQRLKLKGNKWLSRDTEQVAVGAGVSAGVALLFPQGLSEFRSRYSAF